MSYPPAIVIFGGYLCQFMNIAVKTAIRSLKSGANISKITMCGISVRYARVKLSVSSPIPASLSRAAVGMSPSMAATKARARKKNPRPVAPPRGAAQKLPLPRRPLRLLQRPRHSDKIKRDTGPRRSPLPTKDGPAKRILPARLFVGLFNSTIHADCSVFLQFLRGVHDD